MQRERWFPNRRFAATTSPSSCAVCSPVRPWPLRLPRQLT
jgi:hypothetical protein